LYFELKINDENPKGIRLEGKGFIRAVSDGGFPEHTVSARTTAFTVREIRVCNIAIFICVVDKAYLQLLTESHLCFFDLVHICPTKLRTELFDLCGAGS